MAMTRCTSRAMGARSECVSESVALIQHSAPKDNGRFRVEFAFQAPITQWVTLKKSEGGPSVRRVLRAISRTGFLTTLVIGGEADARRWVAGLYTAVSEYACADTPEIEAGVERR